jgi:hypothetical protein
LFSRLDWLDRQMDAWVEAECGSRGLGNAHRRPGSNGHHGYHQSPQGGEMTSKLTAREKWLMEQAYLAGDDNGVPTREHPSARRRTCAEWLQSAATFPDLVKPLHPISIEQSLAEYSSIAFMGTTELLGRHRVVNYGHYVINARRVKGPHLSHSEARKVAEMAAKEDGCRTYVVPSSSVLSFVEVKPEELQWNGGVE